MNGWIITSFFIQTKIKKSISSQRLYDNGVQETERGFLRDKLQIMKQNYYHDLAIGAGTSTHIQNGIKSTI